MQIWEKKAITVSPLLNSFSKSHCMIPTPIKLKENKFRVFYGSRNKGGISNIFYIDVLMQNNQIKILKRKSKPCFTNGKLGSFDDNGVLPSSVIRVGKKIFLYYIGWRPGGTTRFSLIAGLAISNDQGLTFKRYSKAPILKTNNKEPYSILTAPTVLKIKNNLYYMWYVSGTTWKNKNLPNYDIKLAKSKDLKNWKQTGLTCIKLKKNERAVARPYVIYEKGKFKMWYCYEKKTRTR